MALCAFLSESDFLLSASLARLSLSLLGVPGNGVGDRFPYRDPKLFLSFSPLVPDVLFLLFTGLSRREGLLGELDFRLPGGISLCLCLSFECFSVGGGEGGRPIRSEIDLWPGLLALFSIPGSGSSSLSLSSSGATLVCEATLEVQLLNVFEEGVLMLALSFVALVVDQEGMEA